MKNCCEEQVVKTKIKLLTESDVEKLEWKVNAFIKDRCIINISHEVAIVKLCNSCVNVFIVFILYDEHEKSGYVDFSILKNCKDNTVK